MTNMDNPNLWKIYCGNLNRSTEQSTLQQYFSNFGTVKECKLVCDAEQKSKGFAFVTMSSIEDVDNVQLNRPHVIDGKDVATKRAVPRDDPNPLAHTSTKKLFLGGVKEEATEDDIRTLFCDYGTIVKVDRMSDKMTGKFKGYYFITFESEDAVDRYYLIRTLELNGKPVEAKKAEEFGYGGTGGGRGGRGRGAPRGGRGGRGRGGFSPYGGGFDNQGGGGYDGYSGFDGYGSGYGGYGSYGAGDGYSYGNNSGDGYSQGYSSGYGRGRGNRVRGGGYRPY